MTDISLIKNIKPEQIISKWLMTDFPDIKVIPNCHDVIGIPNFYFPQFNGFLFIDNGFWYNHDKSYQFKENKVRDKKIMNDIIRDMSVNEAIKASNGKIMRIFSHEVIGKKKYHENEAREKIKLFISSNISPTNNIQKKELYTSIRNAVPFWDIFNKALSRQCRGIVEYGESSFMDLKLWDEIEEELLDVIVYSYLQIVKIRILKDKANNPIKKRGKKK